MNTKKIAFMGMMVALAFVLSYVDSMIPISIGIPGIKLGLSNIVVVICLYSCSVGETFGIALTRIILTGVTFGNLSMMLYSLAGGLLSFLMMYLLKKTKRFSIFGVSIAGGVSHNVGQIVVAILVLRTELLIYYLPVLLIAGLIAGFAVGFVSGIIVNRISILFLKSE